MQLRGLHHLTLISSDLTRTIAFYRDLLGLAIVHDGPSDDDPGTRHVWFGALDGDPGIRPRWRQWVSSSPAWYAIPEDGLPRFPERRQIDV